VNFLILLAIVTPSAIVMGVLALVAANLFRPIRSEYDVPGIRHRPWDGRNYY
jgi:nucleoside recognition membrane protein YjiH